MSPRSRPWSLVMKVPTSGGSCWFKTTAPGMANDAGLTPLLAAAAPDLVLAPLGADPGRRWMLLPDGGPRLRDAASPATLLAHWERILPRYAQLQLAAAGRDGELLAAGALDRRPHRTAGLLTALLADPWWLRIDEPEGLTSGQVAALRELAPRLGEAAEELVSGGIGASIQHDDLHAGNVLVGPAGHRIVDWGDAVLAHPFGTLLVTIRSVADALSLPDDAPELMRLRDAYLEPFTAAASAARLRELVSLAQWVGMLARALAWRAALPHATAEEIAEWGAALPAWLAELLAEAPGG